jgi:hypothetical protein
MNMTEAGQLQILRTTSEVKKLLRRNFDFSVEPDLDCSPLFKVEKGTFCEPIAKSASGCLFCLCQNTNWPERPLLFVSSEGRAGIIGKNLSEGLSIVVSLPYWEDCLKFSGGGQLTEMRSAAILSESDRSNDLPNLNATRQLLRRYLQLENISDPIQSLHSNINNLSLLFPVFASDGSKFDILFNKFFIKSNPTWRRMLSS